MSPAGRWCAIAAAVLGVLTVSTWNIGGASSEATVAEPDGAQLFRSKGCAGCHAGPGEPDHGHGFPSLADAPSWAGDRRPGVSARDYLVESLTNPAAFIAPGFTAMGPTTGMPLLPLSAAEVDALVDYLLRE